jgi:hypothetical protein
VEEERTNRPQPARAVRMIGYDLQPHAQPPGYDAEATVRGRAPHPGADDHPAQEDGMGTKYAAPNGVGHIAGS